MVERRRGTRFPLESFNRIVGVRNLVRQKLEGHLAPKARILGLIDDAHAAAAQLFQDAIVRDHFADHGRHAGTKTLEHIGTRDFNTCPYRNALCAVANAVRIAHRHTVSGWFTAASRTRWRQ
jgi:hypothetical protein